MECSDVAEKVAQAARERQINGGIICDSGMRGWRPGEQGIGYSGRRVV